MESQSIYSHWSSEKLVERVTLLERRLKQQTEKCELLSREARSTSPIPKPKRTRATRQFDPSKYSTRLIAIKFAYLGQRYNGLEFHANNATPYPTIEEEMWKVLQKAKLIFPKPNPSLKEGEPNWEGCEYSKSGRTDKGVSAFGQVIGIRVRSNRPLESPEQRSKKNTGSVNGVEENHDTFDDERRSLDQTTFHPIKDEIPYPQLLNRLLPPEIRVLAWCPFPPADFSARFSCRERCYNYLFTQPAFAPTVGSIDSLDKKSSGSRRREGWLDIEAMRQAASKLEGVHDFRNFCKVDPSKQIDNFERRINKADIIEVNPDVEGPLRYLNLPEFQQLYPSPDQTLEGSCGRGHANDVLPPTVQSTPKLYAFKVQGSAFLWHQVRHMVAILFLIGQGLEEPSLVDDLLDIERNPQKPTYDMADAAPLVLEDCRFPDADLEWIYLGDLEGNEGGITRGGRKGGGKYGLGGIVDELWKVWHKHKIDETLAGSLLDLVVRGHNTASLAKEPRDGARKDQSQKVYLGGDAPRLAGKYIPVLERPRMEPVEEVNAKYLHRKGLQPPDRASKRSSFAESLG
ncbi:MAG: hypothetical protein Q9181_002281 [Wetmoreana brouardii]